MRCSDPILVGLGPSADSLYEYMLKTWIMTGKKDQVGGGRGFAEPRVLLCWIQEQGQCCCVLQCAFKHAYCVIIVFWAALRASLARCRLRPCKGPAVSQRHGSPGLRPPCLPKWPTVHTPFHLFPSSCPAPPYPATCTLQRMLSLYNRAMRGMRRHLMAEVRSKESGGQPFWIVATGEPWDCKLYQRLWFKK